MWYKSRMREWGITIATVVFGLPLVFAIWIYPVCAMVSLWNFWAMLGATAWFVAVPLAYSFCVGSYPFDRRTRTIL